MVPLRSGQPSLNGDESQLKTIHVPDARSSNVITWFSHQYEMFYKTGKESLKSKWEKCIRVMGDYTENM